MKIGRSLQDIAAELERQATTRRDYLAPQGALTAKVHEGEVVLDGLNGSTLSVQPHAHRQIADSLGVPQKYYERMRIEQPALLAENVNTWLHANSEDKRMVRTLDGRVRAFMSHKFRPLDNYDLASAVLPTLMERGVQVMSAELTETKLYIKGILPSLSDELPEGLQWGGHNAIPGTSMTGRTGRLVAAIVISNSDVGAGALRVEPSVFTTWCTNLAVMSEASMRKYHVGRAFSADDSMEVFRDETRAADDRAFWLKVQDITNAAFDQKVWDAAIATIRNAGKTPILSRELPTVVEVTVKQLALPQGVTGSILTHLARGGDLTQWGLSSAVTEAANDYEDYEGATQLERAGGQVLALDGRAWDAIAKAGMAA